MRPDRDRVPSSQAQIIRLHVQRQALRLVAAGAVDAVVTRVAGRELVEPQHMDLLQALPLAVYATDAEGWITFYNEAAVALWGRSPVLGRERWCGSWRIYRTDGTLLPHDRCPMAIALRENRAVRDMEAVAERPDGTRIRFLPYPTPLRDATEKLVGAVNILIELDPPHGRAIPDS